MITALRHPPPRELSENVSGKEDGRELARLVAECAAADISRFALAVRLSQLPRGRPQPHHLRLARDALDPLTAADRARVFELDNDDLVVIWRGDAAAAVQTCRQSISHLFVEDLTNVGDGPPREDIVQLLSLPGDARTLLAIVEASLLASEPAVATEQSDAPPLDLGILGVLEVALQHADLARFARRRPVCAPGPDATMHLAWEKRFLSMEELVATLVPGRSARADTWLFRRLSRTLDRRMLALLSHPGEIRHAPPFSLNLNVSSILATEFVRFDAMLPARLRGQVILELLPADVMADPVAFQFAREFARVRGYALLLRGLTPVLLRMFPREEIGVQWLQLRWSRDLPNHADPLANADPSHIVLSRADSMAAIAWGRARGIMHFRGAAAHAAVDRPGNAAEL